jgi:small conductance mechanosensitive channel
MRVHIPNAKLFANEVMNVSTNGRARLDLKVGVGYASDLAAVIALIQTLIEAQPDALSAPAPWVGLHEFGDSAIVVRILVWCQPNHLIGLRSSLILDITRAFKTHGIEIPYPHQVHVEE